MPESIIKTKIQMAANKKSSTSKKSSTAKKSSTTTNVRMEMGQDKSIGIEKIENGFLVSESGYKGTGKNQKYYNKKYFSDKNPVALSLPSTASKSISFGKKKN